MTGSLKQRFVEAMSRVAATVNVVTTDGPAGRSGVTVSAMSSVSADAEHPILLICVNKSSVSAGPIRANGVFCVNILRDNQTYISNRFAGRQGLSGAEKFAGMNWTSGITGSPRLLDCLVAFDCRVLSVQVMESHLVVFGSVEDIFVDRAGAPLIYANRRYGTPVHFHGSRTEHRSGEVFKLGVFHTLGPYVVPRVLERLVELDRVTDLRIVDGDQRLISEGFKDGIIDAAVMYDWDLGADVENERLNAYKPYALVSERHVFALAAEVNLTELATEPLILLDAPPSGEYFVSLFHERGIEPNIRYRTGSIEMVRGMVGHGLGYSILVTPQASDRTYDGKFLNVVPIMDEIPSRYVVFARPRDQVMSRAAENFLFALRELFCGQIRPIL
jgi:flavin reductase (DIM6/NTAB) family NADH-FMN oxidoreductase RutF/DNA-binding transcriptional LysR family regulator